ALYMAQNLQLKEALPRALKTVNSKQAPAYTRGMAVLFVGQLGGREHMKEIDKLLTDQTQMGAIRTGTMTINAQMRDVALAALIQLSGQDIQNYNFPYMQNYRGFQGPINLPPYYYGFADDARRAPAFKKWKDSQGIGKPEKKESKPIKKK